MADPQAAVTGTNAVELVLQSMRPALGLVTALVAVLGYRLALSWRRKAATEKRIGVRIDAYVSALNAIWDYQARLWSSLELLEEVLSPPRVSGSRSVEDAVRKLEAAGRRVSFEARKVAAVDPDFLPRSKTLHAYASGGKAILRKAEKGDIDALRAHILGGEPFVEHIERALIDRYAAD